MAEKGTSTCADSGGAARERGLRDLGLAVAAGCAPVGTQSTAGSTIGQRAGLATGWQTLWASDADQDADYAGVASSGATWTTLDIDWNHIQDNGPTTWKWNLATDRAVLSANRHGLQLIGIAGYSPPWARRADCPPGQLHCFPENADDYGRFLGAATARYGRVRPTPACGARSRCGRSGTSRTTGRTRCPLPIRSSTRRSAKSAYAAIKAADPEATVLTGGTAPAPDVPDGSDYEQVPPGSGCSTPTVPVDRSTASPTTRTRIRSARWTDKEWNAYRQTEFLHDVMTAHGDGAKKVWGTEMGAAYWHRPRRTSPRPRRPIHVREYYSWWRKMAGSCLQRSADLVPTAGRGRQPTRPELRAAAP